MPFLGEWLDTMADPSGELGLVGYIKPIMCIMSISEDEPLEPIPAGIVTWKLLPIAQALHEPYPIRERQLLPEPQIQNEL